jgi:hypothetical protein
MNRDKRIVIVKFKILNIKKGENKKKENKNNKEQQ